MASSSNFVSERCGTRTAYRCIHQILVADFRTGNGEVVITELVPEPASIALVGVGLLSLAAVWRRRGPLSHLR